MSYPDEAIEAIRAHALRFLRVVDDPRQPGALRIFAADVVRSALDHIRDEEFVTQILAVIRRASDRDDDLPLLLLRALGLAMHFEGRLGEAVLRLGEDAMEGGHAIALARITWTISHSARAGRATVRAPHQWVRALVHEAYEGEAHIAVLSAISSWLVTDGSNFESLRDVIPDPGAWVQGPLGSVPLRESPTRSLVERS